ncbi:hypothetical protein GALMADRAFT_229656 [Galerina marginata CBS 339.88]|uniref:Mid2 domain-containing protein n=1 Tax=Galerina marginata (strain CBS 339.88) TaxID=685588 RepID=A0A067SUC7_GALM3|nr:hypothetical protein GALMADRAFT_229656 [Galerina marginata CBS 339.88]
MTSPASTVSSPSSPLSSPSTLLPAVAGTPVADSAQSHSGSVPIGAIVGGLLGGLALIGIAVFVFWLRRKRVKNDHQRPPLAPQPYPDPNLSFNPTITTEQYRPYGGAYSVSTNAATPSQFSYPTPTSPSQGIIPPSKGSEAAQRYWAGPVPHENSSDSYTLYESIEPPRYEQ